MGYIDTIKEGMGRLRALGDNPGADMLSQALYERKKDKNQQGVEPVLSLWVKSGAKWHWVGLQNKTKPFVIFDEFYQNFKDFEIKAKSTRYIADYYIEDIEIKRP